MRAMDWWAQLCGWKAVPILQSPNRGKVYRKGDVLRCMLTGGRYNIVDGTARLYNETDVSPFLARDYHLFKAAFDIAEEPSPEYAQAIKVYEMAKKLNTEFLFSHFHYEDPDDRNVLEIGVGNAKLISRFADLGFNSFALDYFAFEMDRAHAAHVATGGRSFERVAAPMSRLPFKDSSHDIVYMHAALHHGLPNDPTDFRWSDPANMKDSLREIRRVLKPDGAFFLLGEGVYPDDIVDRYWEAACQKDERVVYESWYTLAEYEAAFEQAGIFPTLWVDQENHRARVIHWLPNGQRCQTVRFEDGVTLDEYHRLLPAVWEASILPDWIRKKQSSTLAERDLCLPADEASG